jgi:hypothetical protein
MAKTMAKKVTYGLLAWVPWLLSGAAGAVVIWALLGQVALQAQLNDALLGVKQNVALARDLTHGTAEALAPMANTAVTLQSMNGTLKSTTGDLAAMNGSMSRVMGYQQSILIRLKSLNGTTQDVVTLLGDVGRKNDTLLKSTAALATQTAGEADTLWQLSGSAGQSIRHMQTLNRRLAFLKRLPF